VAGESCTGIVCGGGSAITSCATGDDCCPAGCTAGNDLDCAQPPATAITGRQLLVKDDDDPSRRKLIMQSKDPAIDSSTGTGIDPVADGASLQLYNANGGNESVCFQLPSTGWQASGTAPLLGYKYKDTAFANGPCKAATIKHGKLLKVQCDAKLQPIAYSLNEPAQGVLDGVDGFGHRIEQTLSHRCQHHTARTARQQLLAQLAQDDYAAVRAIAGRSRLTLSPSAGAPPLAPDVLARLLARRDRRPITIAE
jgi:hypothetical protein